MALSKHIQLAHAQRRLRRLEEDAAAFCVRLADIPKDHRKPMQSWFHEMLEERRNAVRRLEIASNTRARRSSAA